MHSMDSKGHEESQDSDQDWAVAQADLNLHWAHRSFCWFCQAVAHFNKKDKTAEDVQPKNDNWSLQI